MENNDIKNENINNEEINEQDELTANEQGEATEEPKKKSYLPIIIFSIIGVVAILMICLIFSNINPGSLSNVYSDEDIPQMSEPEEIQVGLTDFSASDADYRAIDELNSVLADYVGEHYDDMGLASAYGFLYSTVTDETIMVRDFVNQGLFSGEDQLVNNIDLIYVKASDVGLSGNDLVACTAYNTKEGYYVSSENLEGSYYAESDYNNLILKYSFTHGNIVSPKRGDVNFSAILAAASIDDSYDIKHIAYDDKYAVVVANKLGDTAQFIHSVLVKNGEEWTVGMGNVARAKNAKQTVNAQYPDMELGLMPIYNIGDYPEIMSDLTDFASQLVDLGMLTQEETQNMYGCSAGAFAYIETQEGRRLIGYMEEDEKLAFYEMGSLEEAISTMVRVQEDPPVFIIKFNL